MRFAIAAAVLSLGILCAVLPANAANVWSSFNNFVYVYTVTPAQGEAIKDFHVYTKFDEWDITHYLSVVMPAGWNFTVTQLPSVCAITWWTTGDPLPVGVASTFGYTHYCAPCCHSWIVTDAGTSSPYETPVDGSWNHPDEPCNIPPEFSDACGGPGLVLAPRYPDQTPVDNSTWSHIKILYH